MIICRRFHHSIGQSNW